MAEVRRGVGRYSGQTNKSAAIFLVSQVEERSFSPSYEEDFKFGSSSQVALMLKKEPPATVGKLRREAAKETRRRGKNSGKAQMWTPVPAPPRLCAR
jgi:hypothetical protein